MANGNNNEDDPLDFEMPTVEVVSGAREMENARNRGGNRLLTFMNPLPTDPEDYRTGQSEQLSSLVQELGRARVDAAQEREEIRRRAAQDASRRLLTRLGGSGLTQAITGIDTGAGEQARQAEQRLQQAEEARREVEAQTEEIEQTAPLEADMRSQEIEQQAEQQATEQAQAAQKFNREQVMQSVQTLNEMQMQVTDAQMRAELQEREMEWRRKLQQDEIEAEREMIQQEQSGMGEGIMEEYETRAETAGNLVGKAASVTQQLQNAFANYDTEAEQFKQGQANKSNLRGMGRGMLENAQSLNNLMGEAKQRGVWQAIPASQRSRIEQAANLASTIGQLGSDETFSAGDVTKVMRETSNIYYGTTSEADRQFEGLNNFNPASINPGEVARRSLFQSRDGQAGGGQGDDNNGTTRTPTSVDEGARYLDQNYAPRNTTN